MPQLDIETLRARLEALEPLLVAISAELKVLREQLHALAAAQKDSPNGTDVDVPASSSVSKFS